MHDDLQQVEDFEIKPQMFQFEYNQQDQGIWYAKYICFVDIMSKHKAKKENDIATQDSR